MRKFVTLLAATTLLASTVALAEDQAGNSNDVLQTVPHQQNAEGLNVAENDAAMKPAADAQEQAAQEHAAENKAPVKKHHHKKHHVKHHHHHKAKPATTEAPASAEPAQPADQPR